MFASFEEEHQFFSFCLTGFFSVEMATIKRNNCNDDSDSEDDGDFFQSHIKLDWKIAYENHNYGDNFPDELCTTEKPNGNASNENAPNQIKNGQNIVPTMNEINNILKIVRERQNEGGTHVPNKTATTTTTTTTVVQQQFIPQNVSLISISIWVDNGSFMFKLFFLNLCKVPRPYQPLTVPALGPPPQINQNSMPYQGTPHTMQTQSNNFGHSSSYNMHPIQFGQNHPPSQVHLQPQIPQMYPTPQVHPAPLMQSNYYGQASTSTTNQNMYPQHNASNGNRRIDPRLARRAPVPPQNQRSLMDPQQQTRPTRWQPPSTSNGLQTQPSQAMPNKPSTPRQSNPPTRPASNQSKPTMPSDHLRMYRYATPSTSSIIPLSSRQSESQVPISRPLGGPTQQTSNRGIESNAVVDESVQANETHEEVEPTFSPTSDTPASSPATPASAENKSDDESNNQRIDEDVDNKNEDHNEVTIKIENEKNNDNISIASDETIEFTYERFMSDRQIEIAEIDQQLQGMSFFFIYKKM